MYPLANVQQGAILQQNDRRNIADCEFGKIAQTIDSAIQTAQSFIDSMDVSDKFVGGQVSQVLAQINALTKTKLSVISEFVNNVEYEEKPADTMNCDATTFDEMVGE